MEEKILSWTETNSQTGMEHFLDMQSVSDKSVSDCVEALIGVYLSVSSIKISLELGIDFIYVFFVIYIREFIIILFY